MPRPLIIKVENHKFQPNRKATGSINTQLLKENRTNLYGSYSQDINDYASATDNEQLEESGSGSLVRSLISRYESSASATRSTLIKHKSKSLSDLLQPQLSITKRAQEDHYDNGDTSHVFNFKKVLSKFEGDKSEVSYNNKTKIYRQRNENLQNLAGVKEKANKLLQNLHESYGDSAIFAKWQDEVVQFLQHLSDMPADASERQNLTKWSISNEQKTEDQIHDHSTLKKTKSLDTGEFTKSLKVKEAKNIFETKVSSVTNKTISRSISAFTTYFTGKPADDSTNFSKDTYTRQHSAFPHYNNNFTNTESDQGEDSDNQGSYDFVENTPQGSRMATQPVLASSRKIQELKNIFESDNGGSKYVPYEDFLTDNKESNDSDLLSEHKDNQVSFQERMLPPAKVITVDEDEDEDEADDLETSKQQIEQLTKDIEEYEAKIENLNRQDKEEASYINETLIRILISLDDVKTYGDGFIQTERRKAIQFVQDCIKKLRAKVRGHE